MDFPPNLHILHGHAGGGGPRLKRSFVSPAQLHLHTFHRLSPGLGMPLHPLSPPLSSLHPGFVPWRRGEYTFDKHHISGTAVCAHVWLHHRKKEKREKKKKRVPFFHKTMETSSFVCEQMAFRSAAPRQPACALQSPRPALRCSLCKEVQENQDAETSTWLQCKAKPAPQKPHGR